MSQKKKQPKHPKPVHVRAKVDLSKPVAKKLAESQDYLSAQANADTQNVLASQAQRLLKARTALVDIIKKRSDLKAALDVNQSEVVLAADEHDEAMRDYADSAADVAGPDLSVLAKLGVTAAATGGTPQNVPVGIPATVAILPGANLGDALVKCSRVPGAGAYVFEYQLESALPSDPWIQAALTKHASAVVTGLQPGQKIRGRVRAVGATAGPWTVPVTGFAR
jgi:hypothetical protein